MFNLGIKAILPQSDKIRFLCASRLSTQKRSVKLTDRQRVLQAKKKAGCPAFVRYAA